MKQYKFYGWEHADAAPIDPEYSYIKDVREFYDVLSELWCAETCAPRMRHNWTKENMTLGQCSITAFLVQDVFGGEVRGILRPGGNYHCYNVVGDCVFDTTSEQFGDEILSYENNPEQFREIHFQKEEKRLRYEYLKSELEKRGKLIRNRADRKTGLIVEAGSEEYLEAAGKLAEHLGVPCRLQSLIERSTEVKAVSPDRSRNEEDSKLILLLNEEGLTLTDGELTMRGDFTKMLPRLKQSNMEREMLVKAARIKGVAGTLTAVDATAGMGEDSLLLAAAGFAVTLFEYDPVIAALLADTLKRSAEIPELSSIVSRMTLIEGDSVQGMQKLSGQPDVILLDPMFPERQKSALIKKKFQLIHRLERPCADETAMLQAAMALKPRKLIIKRPLKGPYLGGVKPSHSLSGKAIRYDCLVYAR